jgi:hypothetical protein
VADKFYPTEADVREFWSGHKRRSKARANAAISPLFASARDKITTNLLEVLNNRRYLKIKDPKKRLRRVKADPKMQQVNSIIWDANEKSLQAIYDNFQPAYDSEVPAVCRDLYPWVEEDFGSCEANDLTKKELANLRLEPFLGQTWTEWIKGNAKLAVDQWEKRFKSVMSGEIRSETAVSRDVQLVREARNILNTNESRNKTIFENSDITVARKAMRDVEVALWQ